MGKHHWPVDRAAQVLGALPLLGLVGSVGTASLALTSATSVDGGAAATRETPSSASPGPRLDGAIVPAPAQPPAGHPRIGDPLSLAGPTPPTRLDPRRTPSSRDDETGHAGNTSAPDMQPPVAEPHVHRGVTHERVGAIRPRTPPTVDTGADTARSLDLPTDPAPDPAPDPTPDPGGGDGNDGGVPRSSAGPDTHRLPSTQASHTDVENDDPPTGPILIDPVPAGPVLIGPETSELPVVSTGTMLSFGSASVSVL